MEKKQSLELCSLKYPTIIQLPDPNANSENEFTFQKPYKVPFDNCYRKHCIAIIVAFLFALISLIIAVFSLYFAIESKNELYVFQSYLQNIYINERNHFDNSSMSYIENQTSNLMKKLLINQTANQTEITKNLTNQIENQTKNFLVKIQNLENLINESKEEIKSFLLKVSALKAENYFFKILLTAQNSSYTNLKEIIIHLKNNITNYISNMNLIKKNVDLLKENITKLEEPSKLIEQFQNISNEIYSISAKVSNITANMSEINNINNQTIKMRIELQNLTTDVGSLQNNYSLEINEIKNQIENLTLEVNFIKQLEKKTIIKNNHMYFPEDAIIHDNIFNALFNKVIEFFGSPFGMDNKTFSNDTWNGKYTINIGTGFQTNQNGLLVHVPEGYKVLWFRVNNDRNATFRVVSKNSSDTKIARYACGYRNLLEISPDGGEPDSYSNIHMWCPIPLYYSGDYMVYSDVYGDDWISGIAFSKNPWNHAKNSGLAYHWALNGGNSFNLVTLDWNSDVLITIPFGKKSDFFVPVVPSGKNKTLYIIEQNDNWVGTMHTSVTVNEIRVERLRTSYSNNPFATHFNSKIYSRYLALTIPAELIPNDAKFVKVTIDLSECKNNIYFREIGTHDIN